MFTKKIEVIIFTIKDFLFYLRYSFEKRGITNSIKLWWSELIINVKNGQLKVISKRSFPAKVFDQLGEKGYYPYQATYYSILYEVLEFTINEYNANSIIDIGAGEGRILQVALDVGFKKVVGVEIVEEYANVAKNKLTKSKEKFPDSVIDLFCTDAINYVPEDRFDVLFLSNPFNELGMRQLFNNLATNKKLPPLIVYVFPRQQKLIESMGYQAINSKIIFKHIEYILYFRKCG